MHAQLGRERARDARGDPTLGALCARHDATWHPAIRGGDGEGDDACDADAPALREADVARHFETEMRAEIMEQLVKAQAAAASRRAPRPPVVTGETGVPLEVFAAFYEDLSPLVDGDDYFELALRRAWSVVVPDEAPAATRARPRARRSAACASAAAAARATTSRTTTSTTTRTASPTTTTWTTAAPALAKRRARAPRRRGAPPRDKQRAERVSAAQTCQQAFRGHKGREKAAREMAKASVRKEEEADGGAGFVGEMNARPRRARDERVPAALQDRRDRRARPARAALRVPGVLKGRM